MAKNGNLTERAKNGRNGAQLVYVMDCINGSSRAADEGLEFNTDADTLQFFFGNFDTEFNYTYNKRLYPCLQQRIAQWLRGLPSCCNIAYDNYSILMLGVKWGVLSGTEDKKADKFIENFFNVCSARILQAAQKVGINPFKYSF